MGVVDDLIATAQPRTEKVRICARGDLVASHAEAVAALGAIVDSDDSLEGNPATSEAAAAVVAIEEEMEAATVTFTLAHVGREMWANLLADHGPSKEERRAGHDHNPKTFPVAAVAASIIDPPTTVEQVRVLAGTREDGTPVLPAGEWNKLWISALMLNIQGTPAPKLAAATDLLRANGRSSTTPGPEASLEDGSLAGSGEQ